VNLLEWLKATFPMLLGRRPDRSVAMAIKKIDTYQKYWNEVVAPDYDEFMKNLDDIRRVFHCASSLFHMADWLYHSNESYFNGTLMFKDKDGISRPVSDEKTFANAIRDLHPDFEVVRGIANAGKHLEVRRGNHAASPVSAANTYVTATGFGVGGFGLGPYGGARRARQEGPNNQDLEFSDLATSVRDMWIAFCNTHKVPLA
jgi:hypothetical protein